MKRRTQQFVAAFVIAGIAVAALCGFLAVDLSTDRYMPADYAPLFQVTSVGPEGVRFAAFGTRYEIGSGQFDGLRETLWEYRGYLPRTVVLTGALTARAYAAAADYFEARREPEEPW